MSKAYGLWFCALVSASALGCGTAAKSMEAEKAKTSATMEAAAESEIAAAEVEVRAAGDEIVDPIVVAGREPVAHARGDGARDPYRHPYETLSVLWRQADRHGRRALGGRRLVHPNILAPLVAERGKALRHRLRARRRARLPRRDDQEDERVPRLPGTYQDKGRRRDDHRDPFELGMEGEADVILTFRNVHNWVKGGFDDQVYAEAFRALKPGGTFGVVEHRAPEGTSREASAKSGYMDQARVIADIEAAGFTFVEASEINANEKDTKRITPKGVLDAAPEHAPMGDTRPRSSTWRSARATG